MFPFLKYIKPTWYYNLTAGYGFSYFPDYEVLPEEARSLIKFDNTYSNRAISFLDASYQSWHKGIILSTSGKVPDFNFSKPTIKDNYQFITKYFGLKWSWFILIIRLITFHNPVKEIMGFIKTRGVSRLNLTDETFPNNKPFLEFSSELIKQTPKVSVIIPTLNRYVYLKNILHDLEKQDYKNFEIIIVDQSDPFLPDFYRDFKLKTKIVRQEEKALWKARNTAIITAEGSWLAFSEDDVRVPFDWLTNHLKCIDFFKVNISAGVFFPEGTTIPKNRNYFKWADQFATGNAFLNKDVFRKTGLFDLQFERQRMGDGEFGLRAYLSGFNSVSNPFAYCEDVKAATGGLRQMGSWDAYRPGSFWSPRPVPSVLYFYRKYFGTKATLISLLINIPPSIIPYKYKRNKQLLVFGSLFAILLMPLIIIQIIRSWRKSSAMLKNPLIPVLND